MDGRDGLGTSGLLLAHVSRPPILRASATGPALTLTPPTIVNKAALDMVARASIAKPPPVAVRSGSTPWLALSNLLLTGLLFLALLVSAGIGFATQRRLHERHISTKTFDSVRLLMAMLVTFSALVLGLLTSSAKERFDAYSKELSAFAADLIELDHRLLVYGTDVEPVRAMLRTYTAAAIADTWPDEAMPAGDYPRYGANSAGVEEVQLGDRLADIDVKIHTLTPEDAFHQQIAGRLRNRVADLIQRRWSLILSADSTISWPSLIILTIWLSIIFAIFALTAPRDGLVYVVTVLSALSIASPLLLILEYSGPQSGLLRLSSAPMRAALRHMDSPHP